MPTRSSYTRMPSTSSRSFFSAPTSTNTRSMRTVLEIAMIAPTNTAGTASRPNSRPAWYPSQTIAADWNAATNAGRGPSSSMRRRLNSSPMENSTRIIPTSDSAWTPPRSLTVAPGVYGPTRMPAMR